MVLLGVDSHNPFAIGVNVAYKSSNLAAKGIAENELPWWPGPSVRSVIKTGFAAMWAEGAGGGHYENMRGAYSRLECGVFVNGNEITVVQNFQ